jgi:hypothetical protein
MQAVDGSLEEAHRPSLARSSGSCSPSRSLFPGSSAFTTTLTLSPGRQTKPAERCTLCQTHDECLTSSEETEVTDNHGDQLTYDQVWERSREAMERAFNRSAGSWFASGAEGALPLVGQ